MHFYFALNTTAQNYSSNIDQYTAVISVWIYSKLINKRDTRLLCNTFPDEEDEKKMAFAFMNRNRNLFLLFHYVSVNYAFNRFI